MGASVQLFAAIIVLALIGLVVCLHLIRYNIISFSSDPEARFDSKIIDQAEKVTLPVESHEYSSFRCLGRPWYYKRHKFLIGPTVASQNCRFKNVCYSFDERVFIFYRNAADANVSLFLDGNAKKYYDFPPDFFDSAYSSFLPLMRVSFEESKFGHTNSTTLNDNYSFILTPGADEYGNFGHAVWERVMPFFEHLSMFEIKPHTTKVVTLKRQTSKYIGAMLTKYPVETLDEMKKGDQNSQMLCFPNLIIGDFSTLDLMRLASNQEIAPKNLNFHKYIEVAMNLTKGTENGIPNEPAITILEKLGRRTFLNAPEILTHLKNEFPKISINVLNVEKVSFWEQAQAIRNSTLLVSPAGAISCGALFLPKGSTLIEFGFYNTMVNATYDYDSMWLTYFNHLTTVIYPTQPYELVMDTCLAPEWDKLQLGHWGEYVYCSYNVNVQLLAEMVRAAISSWSLYHHNVRIEY